MIQRLVLGVVVGAITTLVVLLLGLILSVIGLNITTIAGNFLINYAPVIGILVGLWYALTDQSWLRP